MKKLLLILLCLPFIVFGQDDKIIFSSGDTIIGRVVEVGIKDITYQHKGEAANNISSKRKLAKVIYSSGRTESFEGLKILESKIEREENDKLYKQNQEEQKKIRSQKKKIRMQKRGDFKKSLEIGTLFGASFNNNTSIADHYSYHLNEDEEKNITTIQGLIFKYNYSPHFSINTELNYHISGWKRSTPYPFIYSTNDPVLQTENNLYRTYSNDYLSLPINIEYNFYYKPIFNIKAGIYYAYLIRSTIYFNQLAGGINYEKNDLSEINRFDFGGILGLGLSYPINDKLTVFFDFLAYYGLVNYYDVPIILTDNTGSNLFSSDDSKNRMYRTVLGLTYKIKTID